MLVEFACVNGFRKCIERRWNLFNIICEIVKVHGGIVLNVLTLKDLESDMANILTGPKCIQTT